MGIMEPMGLHHRSARPPISVYYRNKYKNICSLYTWKGAVVVDEMLILISLAKTANVFQDRIIAEAACFLLLMGTFKFPPHVLLYCIQCSLQLRFSWIQQNVINLFIYLSTPLKWSFMGGMQEQKKANLLLSYNFNYEYAAFLWLSWLLKNRFY